MLTEVPSLSMAYCGDGDGVGTKVAGTAMEWENYRDTKWGKVNFSQKGLRFPGMTKKDVQNSCPCIIPQSSSSSSSPSSSSPPPPLPVLRRSLPTHHYNRCDISNYAATSHLCGYTIRYRHCAGVR